MARYIDADDLLEDIIEWETNHLKSTLPDDDDLILMRLTNRNITSLCNNFAKAIVENAITVNAKPVIRGEWKDLDFGIVECSVCKFVEHVVFDDCENQCWYKHCPNCGADMRGD